MTGPRRVPPRRVGAIDLGTNTATLLVAQSGPRRSVVPVFERELYPRLGEALDRTGHLSPVACARALDAVATLASDADAYGVESLSAVGTSALRDGDRGGVFLAELRRLVPSLRAIAAEEEAFLATSGVLVATSLEGPFVCIDVGGGSTEIVFGESHGGAGSFAVHASHSLALGSVRLHDRHRAAPAPYLDAYGDARTLLFHELPNLRAGARCVVAAAGTAATVGAVALQGQGRPWSEGACIDVSALDDVCLQLAALDVRSRAALHPRLEHRADVAPFGAIILQAIAHHLDASSLRVTSAGVAWGLASRLLTGA